MKRQKLAALFFGTVVMLAFAASAGAVDGTIEINQAKVLANGGYPYVISAIGSYRLTGNLTVPGITSGINVTAANVTLDLNGFSITGPGAVSAAPVGITTTGTVENGTITGFGVGVVMGAGGIIRNVHADANGSGIQAGNNTLIQGCTANNTTLPTSAIECLGACAISGNTANGNAGIGIECLGSGCAISGNTANANAVAGIQCDGGGCQISSNTVNSNLFGIFCPAAGNLITANAIDNNTENPIKAADVTTAYGSNVMNGDGAGISGGTSMAGKNTNSCGGTAC